jgi:hypothetical protein
MGIAGALSFSSVARAAEEVSDALVGLNKLSPFDAANDEELWNRLAQAYTVSPTVLNLNNGA